MDSIEDMRHENFIMKLLINASINKGTITEGYDLVVYFSTRDCCSITSDNKSFRLCCRRQNEMKKCAHTRVLAGIVTGFASNNNCIILT